MPALSKLVTTFAIAQLAGNVVAAPTAQHEEKAPTIPVGGRCWPIFGDECARGADCVRVGPFRYQCQRRAVITITSTATRISTVTVVPTETSDLFTTRRPTADPEPTTRIPTGDPIITRTLTSDTAITRRPTVEPLPTTRVPVPEPGPTTRVLTPDPVITRTLSLDPLPTTRYPDPGGVIGGLKLRRDNATSVDTSDVVTSRTSTDDAAITRAPTDDGTITRAPIVDAPITRPGLVDTPISRTLTLPWGTIVIPALPTNILIAPRNAEAQGQLIPPTRTNIPIAPRDAYKKQPDAIFDINPDIAKFIPPIPKPNKKAGDFKLLPPTRTNLPAKREAEPEPQGVIVTAIRPTLPTKFLPIPRPTRTNLPAKREAEPEPQGVIVTAIRPPFPTKLIPVPAPIRTNLPAKREAKPEPQGNFATVIRGPPSIPTGLPTGIPDFALPTDVPRENIEKRQGKIVTATRKVIPVLPTIRPIRTNLPAKREAEPEPQGAFATVIRGIPTIPAELRDEVPVPTGLPAQLVERDPQGIIITATRTVIEPKPTAKPTTSKKPAPRPTTPKKPKF